MKREYAAPTAYFQADNETLASLRQQLAEAEAASRATDFTTRTRGEQDVRQPHTEDCGRPGAPAGRTLQHRLSNRQVPREGRAERFATPRPYFRREHGVGGRACPAAGGGKGPAGRRGRSGSQRGRPDQRARLRITAVRTRIEALDAALHPVTTVGKTRGRGQQRRADCLQRALSEFVAQAREAGMLKS